VTQNILSISQLSPVVPVKAQNKAPQNPDTNRRNIMTASTLEKRNEASAPALSAAELDQARNFLQLTRDYVIGAVKGLSDAQWKFKPAPDRWSIAQNIEHMVFIQELVLGPIREQLATAPPPPAHRDSKLVDGIVIRQFPDRLTKFNPDLQKPSGDWERAAALARVLANYEHFGAYLECTAGLRGHAVEAAPLKAATKGEFDSMDGYQWLLAVAAHNERHCKQILEVKAHRAFPSN
jgi:hypothetical protein